MAERRDTASRSPGVAFRLANLLGAATPGFIAHAASLSLGGVGALAMRDERRMVERHQRRVTPHLNALQMQRRINDAFQSYLRYYIETFRLASLSDREIEAGFSVEGFHHIERAHAAGKGVILALPHVGGWEWAGRWIVQRGYKMSAVVEVLENREAYEAFTDARRAMGVDVIPLDDRAGVAVSAALRAGHVVSLLADRDIQRNGVEVDFFGERTTAPVGPAFFSPARRADRAARGLLHAARRRTPCRRAATARTRIAGLAARRHCAPDPEVDGGVRVAHQACTRAVALVLAKLAE